MPIPKGYSAYPVPTPERDVLARSSNGVSPMVDFNDSLAVKRASQANRNARLNQHDAGDAPPISQCVCRGMIRYSCGKVLKPVRQPRLE